VSARRRYAEVTKETRKTKKRTSRHSEVRGHFEAPSEEHIRMRAYFLYLEREGRPGDPLDDWLRAEQELIRA
jgi:hypothetical protein